MKVQHKTNRRELDSSLAFDVLKWGASATGAGLAAAGRWALNYRSRSKIHIDKWTEPIIAAAAMNAGTIIAMDSALDAVNRNLEDWTAYAVIGTYVALGPLLLYEGNPKIVAPVMKKIHAHHDQKLQAQKKVSLLSWAKTATIAAALYTCGVPQLNQAYDNIKYDLASLVSARQSRQVVSAPSLEDRLETIEEPPRVVVLQPQSQGAAIPTGNLEGVVLGDYFHDILGIKGKAPAYAQVDPKERLEWLWIRKDNTGTSGAIPKVFQTQVSRYLQSEVEPTTLNLYLDDIAMTMAQVDRDLDWQKVKQNERLDSDNQINLVRKLTYKLQPRDLLAISMAELMPGTDGKRNIDAYDFMLRMGGRKYVELIPSFSDPLASFGPYQHTSFVVRHDDLLGGASKVSLALPQNSTLRLPGSMYLLMGDQHHAAAYMNAMNNFSLLVRKATRSQMGKLAQIQRDDTDDIVSFVAMAHHNPEYAVSIAQHWLDDNKRQPLSSYAKGDHRTYVDKFIADRNALQN